MMIDGGEGAGEFPPALSKGRSIAQLEDGLARDSRIADYIIGT